MYCKIPYRLYGISGLYRCFENITTVGIPLIVIKTTVNKTPDWNIDIVKGFNKKWLFHLCHPT